MLLVRIGLDAPGCTASIMAYVVADHTPDVEDRLTSPQIHVQMGWLNHDQELGTWGCPGCTGQALLLRG